MSSTTDRLPERGQVLVLFAGAVVTLLIVAALAFDVGVMMLERRDQQNAADAAALAGARYVLAASYGTTDCSTVTGGAPAATSPSATSWAACHVSTANDSGDDETVLVHVPPKHGEFRGLPGFVEVQIQSNRGSVFGGVIGRATWPVGVMAVAANQPGVTYSFGMLALDPDDCKAIHISGGGIVNSASSVQANSTGEGCGDGTNFGFSRTGTSTLVVTAPDAVCRSVGGIQDQGSGEMTCAKDPFSFALPDPLRNLPAPVKPDPASAMKEVIAGAVVDSPADIPKYCPGAVGGDAPSEANPQVCVLGGGGSGQAGREWILYPGLYPGGLELKGGVTAYLTPGIYWIGGGGFAASDGRIISVNSETDRARATCTLGATPPCVDGGGVLIYNSKLANSLPGPIKLDGNGVLLSLMPYDYPFGDTTIDLVLFQDRTVCLGGDDITLNGSNSDAGEVRGIVYAPCGDVKVNGSSSTFSVDQVIANTFLIDGSGGTVNVLREMGVDAEISAVGLVE